MSETIVATCDLCHEPLDCNEQREFHHLVLHPACEEIVWGRVRLFWRKITAPEPEFLAWLGED